MSARNKTNAILIVSLITILVTACSFPSADPTPAGGGWINWDGEPDDSILTSVLEKTGISGASAPVLESASADMAYDEGMLFEEEAPASAGSMEHERTQQNSMLRAGSVDDNEKWDDYLLYRLQFADWGYAAHDVPVTDRVIFHVVTTGGSPVLAAGITIKDANGHTLTSMRTHSNGEALFFPAAFLSENDQSYTVQVEKDGAETGRQVDRSSRTETFTLDSSAAGNPVRLDIQFLIDVTGSMSDEILQLKDNMIEISEAISRLPSNPEARFAMTIYRDRGDEFVSRSFDFTPDVAFFTSELEKVSADGGGDYPESLNEGFHNALILPEWRVENTVSLLFVIADAPPHLDYPQDYDYAEDIFEANVRGIKVFPIASSGLDDQGEYILRQMAQISGGKFLFLTYGADGAPGDETTHHVDDYSVLSLDQLVVQIVTEELAAMEGQQQ
ncbi:MAG: VWA domain-containing protein [Anaerolineales bacterium]|nr:VWA domain-containing protein [Anaerolineales bacterium]